MAEHTETTKTLNTLIATLLDSVEGYQKSAGEVENRTFADKFNARAQERQRAVAKLQAVVASHGGSPEDESSTMGSIHRAFQSLREAVSSRDDKAIVAEVERGEDYLKEKFQTAMGKTDLTADARAAVDEAWTSVKSGHDEMSQLKHSLQA